MDKRSSSLKFWNYVLLVLLSFDAVLIPLEIAFDDVCPVWIRLLVELSADKA